MTTQEYILDPQFEVILVSVAIDKKYPEWFSGTKEEIRDWLEAFAFDDPSTLTIGQNVLFDGAILEWVFDIHPARYYDTMMGARPFDVPFTENQSSSLAAQAKYHQMQNKGGDVADALGMQRADFTRDHLAAYGSYCVNDVLLTRAISAKQIPLYPWNELGLIDLTIKKFTRPQFVLNTGFLLLALEAHKGDKKKALEAAGLTGTKELLSNPKFAMALQNLGIDPPQKISPTTGKLTWAFAKTDQGLQALLTHENPNVQRLVEARLATKSTLMESRLESFIRISQTSGRFGLPLLYYGAMTGRYSGWDKINIQNMPRGSALRTAMEAPPGYVVCAGDLSQVEARAMATFADETHLEEAFRNHEDVYSNFSSELYNMVVSKETPEERLVGKVSVLQLQYGSGADTLQLALRNSKPQVIISSAEARRTVKLYRLKHPRIVGLWKLADRWLQHMMGNDPTPLVYKCIKIHSNYLDRGAAIELPNGMPMYYPDIYRDAMGDIHYRHKRAWAKMYGSKLVQNIVQALARIIITDAELFMARKGYPPCASIHDELVFILKRTQAEAMKKVLKKVLVRPPAFMPTVPLDCEVEYGRTYAACK